MNSDRCEQLVRHAGAKLSKELAAQFEKAEHLIAEEVESMKERGEVMVLGEDEERLLTALMDLADGIGSRGRSETVQTSGRESPGRT